MINWKDNIWEFAQPNEGDTVQILDIIKDDPDYRIRENFIGKIGIITYRAANQLYTIPLPREYYACFIKGICDCCKHEHGHPFIGVKLRVVHYG
jgi:hypothetical protein